MKIFLFFALWFLCFSNPIFAKDLDLPIVGTTVQSIATTHKSTLYPQDVKDIEVTEYAISDDLNEQLHQQAQRRLADVPSPPLVEAESLPKKVQLGMANVPVLDQGLHGSCTVFAVTAAIDASLHRGDYVSQLCLLQLGRYFEKQNNEASGWHGASMDIVLKRIQQYGVMSIANQHYYGCGGSRLYPTYYFTPHDEMSPEQYIEHHFLPMVHRLRWEILLKNSPTHFNPSVRHLMKAALNAGSRLVITTLLPRSDLGNLGATGRYHYANDTWVMTHDIAQDMLFSKKIPGHTMVITGYDDQAQSIDHAGHVHQGLFKLRNSWGAWVGDWGDFYMSYDYAEVLVRQGVRMISQ